MYSNIVTFEQIIEGVKDDTGLTNLQNLYPKIRRLIYRCEKDIGFGSSVILKRIKYSVEDGSIIVSGSVRKIKLPTDIIAIEEIGMCSEGMCPEDYRIQGNYLFLCKSLDSFSFIYYTMLCDGEGNPLVSENHYEAVVSGIAYWLYKPKRWLDKGSASTFQMLERYYEERIGEARGDDAMPSTVSEWEHIGNLLKMSYRDILIYSPEKKCFCEIPLSVNEIENQIPDNQAGVYYWQYNSLQDNISLAPFIDQLFLDDKRFASIQSFTEGLVVDYSSVGRIGFALQGVSENEFKIVDIFDTDITSLVFDSYYNADENLQIYISKEYYSYGNIYFKLIPN